MPIRTSLTQPLSLRRDYGSSEERDPSIAKSGLPGGGPSDKGLPVDDAIPGTSTFNKPEDDIRDFDKSKDDSGAKDTPIYRKEMPDDQLKDRDRIDTKEDWAQGHDNIGVPGKGEWDTTIKTRYPYRDDRKHKHYASSEYVLQSHLAQSAHELVVSSEWLDGEVKIATRVQTIEEGLNPLVTQRSRACTATLKRADIPNLRWLFAVDCGNGPKVVRVKATRKQENVSNLSKMDLHLSCSCPAWRWLGAEHHSKSEGYIDGKPRGTASVPVIRDPENINRVCKHVAAVLSDIRKWQVGPKRQAVKTAMEKRACELCVAESAIYGKDQDVGYRVAWEEAPSTAKAIYVRARGEGPAFKPAEFQLRRDGEVWPSTWLKSADLAGDLALMGLDIQWPFVPKPVQAWVTSNTQVPFDFLHQLCRVWRSRG